MMYMGTNTPTAGIIFVDRIHKRMNSLYLFFINASDQETGIDNEIPVGIIAVLPDSILISLFKFAARSIPDEPLVSYLGKGISFENLLISIFVIH